MRRAFVGLSIPPLSFSRLLHAGLLSASILCLSAFSGTSASAQRNNPLIEQGEGLYDELRFEEALQVLSAALVRSGNTNEDRATIFRLLAFTYNALGRDEESAGAYRSLLSLSPDYEPEGTVAPRVRTFFSQVRTQWESEGRPGLPPPAPVTIAHRSPAQQDRTVAVQLRASLEDPSQRVERLVLAYRQGTNDVFRRVDCDRDGDDFLATIPGEDVRPPLVEYYFEAVDGSGLPVAARGDVAAPLRIAVEAEQEGGIATKWWFWTAVGVGVAAAIVTTVVVVRNNSSGPEQGTLIVNPR